MQERARNPGYSRDVVRYVETLVDPYGHDAVHVPSPFPYRRTNVKEIKTVNLKDYYVPFGASGGECYVEIYPSVNNTLLITANNSEAQSTLSYTGSLSGQARKVPASPSGGSLSRHCAQQLHSYQGRPSFRLETTVANSVKFDFAVDKFSPSAASIIYHIYGYASGAWALLGSTAAGVNIANDRSITINLPASCEAVSFESELETGGNSGQATYSVGFSISAIAAPGVACPNTISAMVTESMGLVDKILDLESYSVTALSALVTYEGSDLNNGGKVYSAVVPINWQPLEDIVQSISSISHDRYDGPLKEGTHLHWFPSHLDELMMTNATAQHPQSKKFVIYVQADAASESTRLRITQHQQYYSQSPSYGSMTYGPSSWSLSPALAWLARSIPLATSNDDHLVDKAIAKIQSAAKAGLVWALQNPEKIAAGIEAIAAL